MIDSKSICQTSWAYADGVFTPEQVRRHQEKQSSPQVVASKVLSEINTLAEVTPKQPPPRWVPRGNGPSWDEMEAARKKRNAAQEEYDRRIAIQNRRLAEERAALAEPERAKQAQAARVEFEKAALEKFAQIKKEEARLRLKEHLDLRELTGEKEEDNVGQSCLTEVLDELRKKREITG